MENCSFSKTEMGHLEMQASINGITATSCSYTVATGPPANWLLKQVSVFGISNQNKTKVVGLRMVMPTDREKLRGSRETFTLEYKTIFFHRPKSSLKSLDLYNTHLDSLSLKVRDWFGYWCFDWVSAMYGRLKKKDLRLLIPKIKMTFKNG